MVAKAAQIAAVAPRLPLEPKNIRAASVLKRVAALPYGLKGLTLFVSLLLTEDHEPMVLEPFQRKMLRQFFGGAIETVIIIPTGNGKTTLLSGLALYHILMVRGAECVIGASSRDQATILFRQAETMIERSELEEVFDVKGGYRHIRCGGGRIRVMASGAGTGDGVIPTLALVDELHRHPNADLYVMFRQKVMKRHGQMVTISTAGGDLESPLGRIRRTAYEMPTFKRNNATKYVTAKTPDGSFVLHEWCLLPTEDSEDLALIAKANPASWKTKKDLAALKSSPTAKLSPWDWLKYVCGIWTEGDEPPIDPEMWAAARGVYDIAEGEQVWLGVVRGSNGNDSAIVVVRQVEGAFFTKAVIVEGRATYAEIEGRLRDLWELYDAKAVVYMGKGFQRSADLLEEDGITMIEMTYSDERMTEASGTFLKLLEEGNLHHDGDPELRAHVMGASKKVMEKGWRFIVDPKRPASALFALVATCHVALTQEPPPFATVEWV